MERLSVDDYYRAALDVLGESGSETLTINALCERLQVTKGSFYHHFGSMPAFVEALLLFWEAEHTERLTAISKAQPDATLRITTLIDSAVGLPHASEAAIRAWARSNAEVNAATVRVDRRRERHVTDAIVALGLDRLPARLLARMTINLLVGAQQREQPVDVKRLRHTLQELQKLIFLEADPGLVAHLVQSTSG